MQLRGRNSEPQTWRNRLSFVRTELLSAAFTVAQQSHHSPGRFQGEEGSQTERGALGALPAARSALHPSRHTRPGAASPQSWSWGSVGCVGRQVPKDRGE